MTTPKQIQAYAPQLAEIYRKIDSLNFDAKDLLASAKDAGVNVSALRKVAKELLMEADKRAKKYEDEAQTDLFRFHAGLLDDQGEKSVAIANKVREEKFVEAVKDIDALTGGNVADGYQKTRATLRKIDVEAAKEAAP